MAWLPQTRESRWQSTITHALKRVAHASAPSKLLEKRANTSNTLHLAAGGAAHTHSLARAIKLSPLLAALIGPQCSLPLGMPVSPSTHTLYTHTAHARGAVEALSTL